MICSNKSSGLKNPRRHMQARPISEVAGRRSPVASPSLARQGNCPISANLGGLYLPHWGAKYPCPWRFPAKRVRITCNHQTLGSCLTNVRYFTSQHLPPTSQTSILPPPQEMKDNLLLSVTSQAITVAYSRAESHCVNHYPGCPDSGVCHPPVSL